MKYVLKIRNPKEERQFAHRLFLYRSVLFRWIPFQLDGKKEYQPIVDCLNVKGRKKRIQKVYEEACHFVDSYYKDKNLCDFQNGQCLSQRVHHTNKIDGCCRGCFYRTGGKCPTANLACKLFYCATVREKNKTLTMDEIPVLRCLSPCQRFILKSDYFSSKGEVIRDLYSGFFLAPPRIVYRQVVSFFKRKRQRKRQERKSLLPQRND